MMAFSVSRAAGFSLWLLVGLSAAYWGLRLGEDRAPAVALPEAPVAMPGMDGGAIALALGAGRVPAESAAAAAVASRIELRGVIAQGRQGVALLSVDGQPGRAVRVGAQVREGVVLHSVGPRHAQLADAASGAPLQRLEMPAEPPPAPPAGLGFVAAGR